VGSGSGLPHPPLGADPASMGAAERLSTASAELAAGLTGHVVALVASLEHLAGIAVSFTETDAANAAALTHLDGRNAGPAPVNGVAPHPPPIGPDLRAPLPPPAGMRPEALSAAAHTGDLAAGEPFTAAWSTASTAARAAADQLRTAVNELPETLDGPASTPAASRHLLRIADGLDHLAERGHALATQASTYAGDLAQARTEIPTPQQLAAAHERVVAYAQANAASGGLYAAPLAQAMADKNQLLTTTVTGYTGYHANVDTTTTGTASPADPGTAPAAAAGAESTEGDPAAGGASADAGTVDGLLDPLTGADPAALMTDPLTASPAGSAGELAGMLPQMIPTVLGAAGGLIGGLVGAVTQAPEALLQAGTQAIGAAVQGLAGGEQSSLDGLDLPTEGIGDGGLGGGGDAGGLGEAGMGGLGDLGGGDGGATTPAGGGAPSSLPVGPTTGAPPTPAVLPVGGTAAPPPGSPGMGGGMPMGMPMGGMGGMAGPGGGAAGEGDARGDRTRTVTPRPVPHTEDVTGRTDTNRLNAAAAANRATNKPDSPPPNDDAGPPPPNSSQPIVRRLTTRPPKEPT